MKDYIDIAKQYFKALEGVHLYPPLSSIWLIAWCVMSAVWVASLGWFLFGNHGHNTKPGVWTFLVPEVLWLFITFRIQAIKQQRFLLDTTQRYGTAFSSSEDCRRHLLTMLLQQSPSKFLSVAKEIDDLISLQTKFRKYSDLSLSELGRKVYDRDSKARLLTLLIVPVSMIVALMAKSEATLDTLFEAFYDPGARALLGFIVVAATVFFMLFVGIQTLFWTIADALASWSTTLFDTSHRWVVGYLVRDLLQYHCPTELVAGNENGGELLGVPSTATQQLSVSDMSELHARGDRCSVPLVFPKRIPKKRAINPKDLILVVGGCSPRGR